MKKFVLALLLLLGTPARGALQGQAAISKIDWRPWHKNFDLTLAQIIDQKVKRGRWQLAGRVHLSILVSSEGRIAYKVLEDESTNLGLIVPNAVLDIKTSGNIKFPEGSQRGQIIKEITVSSYSIIDKDTDTDLEIIK